MSDQAPRRKCWANSLGGCDKMSREHVISQAVFSHGCDCPPIAEGFYRVPAGPIPETALTAKVLCKKHNSALSPLDAEAGRLAKVLLDSARRQDIGRPEVSGSLIERWALKTLINGLAAGWSDSRKWMPDDGVVRCIFGMAPIPEGCGIYSVDGSNADLESPQDAQVTPVWATRSGRRTHFLGGYIRLHGLRFFVAVHDEVVKHMVGPDVHGQRVFEKDGVRFVYRPAFISVGPLGCNRNGIVFRW